MAGLKNLLKNNLNKKDNQTMYRTGTFYEATNEAYDENAKITKLLRKL